MRYSRPVTNCRAEKRMGGDVRKHRTVYSIIPTVFKTSVGYGAQRAIEMGKHSHFFFFPHSGRKNENIFRSMRTTMEQYPYCSDSSSGDLSPISGVSMHFY